MLQRHFESHQLYYYYLLFYCDLCKAITSIMTTAPDCGSFGVAVKCQSILCTEGQHKPVRHSQVMYYILYMYLSSAYNLISCSTFMPMLYFFLVYAALIFHLFEYIYRRKPNSFSITLKQERENITICFQCLQQKEGNTHT